MGSVPVALFFFNRPALTAQVFERIRQARPERLFLVADGPRANHPEDEERCAAARAITAAVDWPCEVSTDFSEQNLGCRRRISSGLSWVFDEVPEAIILEDDCLPDASFFTFCADMLERYRDDTRVMHIGGSNFQNGRKRGEGSYYFSRYTLTWGWATWRRAWQHYDVDMAVWPRVSRENLLAPLLRDPFEISFWNEIFSGVFDQTVDTWDYQWTLACWMQHGLSIVPNDNLVTNIGAGPDALHFKSGHSTIGLPVTAMGDLTHPELLLRDHDADSYAFNEHVAGKERRWQSTMLGRLKCRLALRSRTRLMLDTLRTRYSVQLRGLVLALSPLCL